MRKILTIDPTKCTGCRACEVACSVKKEGRSNPSRSRIRVIKWEELFCEIPMVCQQCESPICAVVCPVNAIYRDKELGRVIVNYDLCVGCRMCVVVCPFGGMGFDSEKGHVIKCDLCDGDPTCVRFCETKALRYEEVTDLTLRKMREAAEKFSEFLEKFGRGQLS